MSKLSVHDIVGLSAYNNKIQIPSGHTLELNGNMKVPVWTEGSKPQNPETGLFGYNTSLGVAELYDGNEWVTVGQQRLTGTTQDVAGYAASEVTTALSASSPSQRWIKPDQIQPFQIYVADNMASLGVVPSGGPNWVYNVKGLNIISRSIINQTDTMLIDYDDFLKLVQRLYGGGTDSPYFYWTIWDIGNQELIGITRTYFTNGDFATWRDHHTGDNPPSLSPYGGSMIPHWDVWGTNNLPGGSSYSYTISNATSEHVRSIPYRNTTDIIPGGSYNSTSHGLHYKRTGSGEHYPWRNSSDENTSEGYFWPYGAGTTGFYGFTGPTGNGILHYIFIAEN